MAKISNNPIANALDQRIRTIVEQTIDEAIRRNIREVFEEELAGALGSVGAQPAPVARRRGRPPGRKSARVGKATTTRRGRAPRAAAGAKRCEVAGCKRPYRSQGYCAAHYQAARKYGWPMPAEPGFQPPPRPSRGRPPKESARAAE